MCAFGIEEKNEREDRLTEFAEERKLFIANTLFQKPKNRYWTWESPEGEQETNRLCCESPEGESRKPTDCAVSHQKGNKKTNRLCCEGGTRKPTDCAVSHQKGNKKPTDCAVSHQKGEQENQQIVL